MCIFISSRRALANTQCYFLISYNTAVKKKKWRNNALKQLAIPNKIFLLPSINFFISEEREKREKAFGMVITVKLPPYFSNLMNTKHS